MTLEKVRLYEKWWIFLMILVFIGKSLYLQTDLFDMINRAYLYDPGYSSLVKKYSHFWNTVFPWISAGLLIYSGWIVFHYFFFPRFTEKALSKNTLYTFLLTSLLVLTGVFVFLYFKLFWRFTLNEEGGINGVLSYSTYRKFAVFKYFWFVFAFYFLVEGLLQILYALIKLINTYRNNAKQDVLLLTLVVAISFVFVSFMAAQEFPYINEGFNGERLIQYAILGIFIYILQEIAYQNLRKRVVFTLLGAFILSILFSLLYTLLGNKVTNNGFVVGTYMIDSASIIAVLLTSVTLLIGASIIMIIRNYIDRKNIKLQTEVNLKSAELDQLKNQVNPHFLFNTLNTLYSVSLKEKAETTAVGIQKLGDMMRFILNENNQELIPLEKEIEQLENYIEIQKMRLDENQNIKVEVNIQRTDKEFLIAPMLLNPFVENAFKHGISFRNPSWIFVTLTYDNNFIRFRVHNSLHKLQETDTEKNNHGIGLENVKKRLELIYPGKHNLQIEQSEQDFFVNLSVEV